MNDFMELDPREKVAVDMRNKAIQEAVEGKIIPGRSFLEQPEFKGVTPTETSYDDGRPSGFQATLPDGRSLERNINYVREQGPDEKWHNTDALDKISERIRASEILDGGKSTRITETGKDLHQEHAWESVNTVSKNESGAVISEHIIGSVTEGEKTGETWDNSVAYETKDGITKKTRTNTGVHFEEGNLVPYKVIKTNFYPEGGDQEKDCFYNNSTPFDAEGKVLNTKQDHYFENSNIEKTPAGFKPW